MPLLHSSSLQLQDFPPDQIPPYAILSHTWVEGEVLLADMESGKAKDKVGYGKIQNSCKLAADEGFDYI